MSVAVCVPFRPRNDHETRVWAWVEQRWRSLFPDWQVCAADSGHEPFNRSASRNAAAEQCPDADVLVWANSDTTFLDSAEMATAVDIVRGGEWVLPALYVEVTERWTDEVLALDPGGQIPDPMDEPLWAYSRHLPDSPAGPQIVSQEWFQDIGRWDECFGSGWGYE